MKKFLSLALVVTALSASSVFAADCDLSIQSKLDANALSRADKFEISQVAKAKGYNLKFSQETRTRYILDLTDMVVTENTNSELHKGSCWILNGSIGLPCLKSHDVANGSVTLSGKAIFVGVDQGEEIGLALINFNDTVNSSENTAILSKAISKLSKCSN